MASFIIVNANEWAGLYIDGKLVTEGHSIREGELVEHLAAHGVCITRHELSPHADARMCQNGDTMPTNFSDVEYVGKPRRKK